MMNHLFSLENTTPTPIEDGDAGIILRKDGSFRVFNTHKNITAENITERQIEQGMILMAFGVALKNPAVMRVLFELSQDPRIVGDIVEKPGSIQ